MLTAEQKKRVADAIKQTEKLLALALAHAEQFQEKELIAYYEKHIVTLNKMLGA